jgi:signal transduction histidine kinase
MQTEKQIIDLFPIPGFVVDKNNLEIIHCNNNGLKLTQMDGSLIKNQKISKFINATIQPGEVENCNFKVNESTGHIGNLNVQSFGDDNFIITFLRSDNAVNTTELIAAKERAEENERLKSAFLANISHEIRTSMNGILGFSSLLLEHDLSDETKEEYINIIHKSGERLINTVNDIIEISKIDAGILEVRKSGFNLDEIVKNLLGFFQPQAQRKGLSLHMTNKLNTPEICIFTDKNKLETVLSNLIKNAIKFTHSGGIEVNYCIKGDSIQFCVKDTGIGVPHNRIKSIFNRFEQADIEDKEVYEGSGLGLAIAKSYILMLGGDIWIESFERVGSSFYFTLPYSLYTKELN